jgi:hypothetical protein
MAAFLKVLGPYLKTLVASPLGIAGLVILVVGFVAVTLFKNSSGPVRLLAFSIMGGGFLIIYTLVLGPKLSVDASVGELYVGQTSGKCFGIVSSNAGNCGGTGKFIGHAVAFGQACDTPLLLGLTPDKNAGWIVTQPGFRDGQTVPFGCSVLAPYTRPTSVQLYVITGPNPPDIGIITTDPHYFSGDTTTAAGFTY